MQLNNSKVLFGNSLSRLYSKITINRKKDTANNVFKMQ